MLVPPATTLLASTATSTTPSAGSIPAHICVARLLQPRWLIVSRLRWLATAVIRRFVVAACRAIAITRVESLHPFGRGI